ncbi:hypothetical protein NQ176_g4271 [Zarea fungicola]|uniref:Uncharacterized protein n=1 Tax=Zarea fungicola TaxID=93591 RepID=A0ACC1NEY1_9HYPO|nr:hypothetical protein NQ176_g4271 [Lecanicillium fungicola]
MELHVVIAGAGIAGLAAAVSLRRAGHRVELYEQSSLNDEIGAAITVPPNASRILLSWGVVPEDWAFVRSEGSTINNPFTMETMFIALGPNTAVEAGGVPMYLAHRVDLHNCLKWLATRPEGPGLPAQIHRRGRVSAYDPSGPSITLQDGRTISADVVVGADGVHSLAAEAVLQRKVAAIAPTTRLIAGWYHTNTIHNFVGLFSEASAQTGREDWQARVDAEEVITRFKDFHPDIVNIIRKANDVRRWPLLYRPPLEKWHRDRLVLVGDAAHPMLPHQGQGGAQSIEDGLALGIALCGTTSKDEICERFKIYETIRRNRASVIQILSNVGMDQAEQLKHEVLPYLAEDKIPTNLETIRDFNFGHDATEASLEAMHRYQPNFALPDDFFDRAVIGAPKTEPSSSDGLKAAPIMSCGVEVHEPGYQTVEIS